MTIEKSSRGGRVSNEEILPLLFVLPKNRWTQTHLPFVPPSTDQSTCFIRHGLGRLASTRI